MSLYSLEVLADSPTAYWRLDETSGTTASDSSGNGNDATFSMSVVHIGQPPLIHDGYSFQWYGAGPTGITTTGLGTLAGGAWTVEAWINTASSGDQPILALVHSSFVNLFFRVTSSGNLSAATTVLAAGGSTASSTTADTVNDGKTHHVVAVKSGGTIHIYIDGVEASYSSQTSYTGPDESLSGGGGGLGYASTVFSGYLDEIAFWNNVSLSTDRILAHYNAGGPGTADSAAFTDSAIVTLGAGTEGSAATPQAINVEVDWADAGAFTYLMEVLVDQPVAYWRLGEPTGTAADDITGNGHTGTYHGSPNLGTPGAISGDLNTAITLDGASQYVEIPDA